MKIAESCRTTVNMLIGNKQIQDNGTIAGTNPPELANVILFIGYCSDRPLILALDSAKNEANHIDTGYFAIGSGNLYPLLALTAVSHFEIKRANLFAAKLLAYRVMQDAIRISNTLIGPPIRMIEMRKPIASQSVSVHELSDGELQILETQVESWKQSEMTTLREFSGMNLPISSDPSNSKSVL